MAEEQKKNKKTSETKTQKKAMPQNKQTKKVEDDKKAKTTKKQVEAKKTTENTKKVAQNKNTSKKASEKEKKEQENLQKMKARFAEFKKEAESKAIKEKATTIKKEAESKVIKEKVTTIKKEAEPKVIKEKTTTIKKAKEPQIDKKVKNKKQEPKQDTKESEKEPKKKEKKYIEISIGLFICVIIIIALIIVNVKLGMLAYNIITQKENGGTNTENRNDKNASVTQEIGNVLSTTDELAQKVIEKITFEPQVTASIYNIGEFTSSNIPNDLKLKIGWAKAKEEEKLKSTNANNESVEAIEEKTMQESIKKVFGQEMAYKQESFNYANVSLFSASKETVIYNSGLYTSTLKQAEETIEPLIYQEIQKVVKYSDKVAIYVKTAYINVEEGKYSLYKEFNNGEFKDKLLELEPEQLWGNNSYNKETGEGALGVDINTSLNNIRSKLKSYKYTFTLEEATQEYCLTSFKEDKEN